MRILVLGAGAVGGYFGGRLAAAGANVTFLVRPRRAEQLARDGLVVLSPHGDLRLAVRTVTREAAKPDYDLTVLSCKAYDLADAIESLRPAMGEGTLLVPLLNGVAHLKVLDEAFGRERVLGGTCHLAGTLTESGEILQLTALHRIAFGVRQGNRSDTRERLAGLERAYSTTAVPAVLAERIETEIWEKFVMLATLAGMTCLMRASAGDIMRAERGRELMLGFLDACRRIAMAEGERVRDEFLATAAALLTEPGSPFTASMLRDIEAGRRTEAEHVIGDIARRAQAAGIDAPLLAAAHCHLQAYEARRAPESV